MIDLVIKAYPDPNRDKRIECIERAKTLAIKYGHDFELMTNKDIQKYFTTPIDNIDFGVYTFPKLTVPIRFRKATSIPNLLYLDTDVYLHKIPKMKKGRPYCSSGAPDCIIGVNDCCEDIKSFLTKHLISSDIFNIFNDSSYIHYGFGKRFFIDHEGKPITPIEPVNISTDPSPEYIGD